MEKTAKHHLLLLRIARREPSALPRTKIETHIGNQHSRTGPLRQAVGQEHQSQILSCLHRRPCPLLVDAVILHGQRTRLREGTECLMVYPAAQRFQFLRTIDQNFSRKDMDRTAATRHEKPEKLVTRRSRRKRRGIPGIVFEINFGIRGSFLAMEETRGSTVSQRAVVLRDETQKQTVERTSAYLVSQVGSRNATGLAGPTLPRAVGSLREGSHPGVSQYAVSQVAANLWRSTEILGRLEIAPLRHLVATVEVHGIMLWRPSHLMQQPGKRPQLSRLSIPRGRLSFRTKIAPR